MSFGDLPCDQWPLRPHGKYKIPADIEFRAHENCVALWHPESQKWVAIMSGDIDQHLIDVGLNNLYSSIFEDRHPGEFMAMIKRHAKRAADGKRGVPPEDAELWTEYKLLNKVSDMRILADA